MKPMGKALRTALLASVLAAGAPIMAAAQEVSWDMPNEYGETSISRKFAERLAANSGGRILITGHFNGSLGYKSKDHWAAVEGQAVPIASTYTGVFTGYDPIFLLNDLPFMATSPAQSKALIDAARPYFAKAFSKGNQLLLLTEPWSPVGLWTKRPISSVADMQGLKVRTYDKNSTVTLQELGATAIQLSWADVIPALSTNVIEAVLTSEEGGLSANFQEYLDHFHYLNFTMGSSMVHINKDVFDALPEDLRQIVLDTAEEVEAELWAHAQDRIDLNVQRLQDANVTAVRDVPESFIDELKAASQVAINEWRELIGGELADEILAAYAKQLEMVSN